MNATETLKAHGINIKECQKSFQDGIGYSAQNRDPLNIHGNASPAEILEMIEEGFACAFDQIEDFGDWTPEEIGKLAADNTPRNIENLKVRKALFAE